MMKLKKQIQCLILMLLSCFGNCLANNNDSICISINDVRIINERIIVADNLQKQIELYKELNNTNREVITNLILENTSLKESNNKINKKYKKEYNKVKFLTGCCCGLGTVCILLIFI